MQRDHFNDILNDMTEAMLETVQQDGRLGRLKRAQATAIARLTLGYFDDMMRGAFENAPKPYSAWFLRRLTPGELPTYREGPGDAWSASLEPALKYATEIVACIRRRDFLAEYPDIDPNTIDVVYR